MKLFRKTSPFRCGQAVELSVDVNAIPAGVYRFIEKSDELLLFQVGEKIVFGMVTTFLPFLKAVDSRSSTLTPTPEFLNKYFRLLEQNPCTKIDPKKFSFCMMDQSLSPKIH